MLTFPAMFALVACSVGIFIALLAARLGRVGTAGAEASLVPVALTAAAFALCDLATYAALPVELTVAGQRVGVAFGALHVAAWLRFSGAHLGLARAQGRVWVAYVAIAALLLVPGLAYTGEIRRRMVPHLGLVYNEAVPTAFGVALTLAIASGLALVGARYEAARRRGVAGTGAFVVAFGLYVAVAVNDILGAYGVLDTPSLLDGAFFPPLGVAVWRLADRFVEEARALEQGRAELLHAAADRGRALDEATAAIARDARLASLGAFSGAVAHAINNPASVAAANLTHLCDATRGGAATPSDLRDVLLETRDALARIGGITRQLLHASRLSAAPVGGEVAVTDALERAIVVARERGRLPAMLDVDTPEGLYAAVEGPVLVEVLASLLDECAASGGRVTVTARARAGRVELIVEDDGPAMDAASLAAALEPLAATRVGRTALGPSICRALLLGHGGDLTMGPRPGGGTRIAATLPSWNPPAPEVSA